MNNKQYELLYHQTKRSLEIQEKLNSLQQEKINSQRIIMDQLEIQNEIVESEREHLTSMLSEIRDMAADDGDERITTH